MMVVARKRRAQTSQRMRVGWVSNEEVVDAGKGRFSRVVVISIRVGVGAGNGWVALGVAAAR